MMKITHDRLRELVKYDEVTGLFTRRVPFAYCWKVGDICGSITPKGYVAIKLDGKSYLGHVLAWFYVNGSWPIHMVDHEDNQKSNNVWTNLRAATAEQNGANAKLYRTNTTGHKNISQERSGMYRVRVTSHGKLVDFGKYALLSDAVEAANAARKFLSGEFARSA